MEEFFEKTLSTKEIYNGKVFKIIRDEVELINGKKSIREVALHPGGVVILAKKENNTILMVEQFRYPLHQTSLELPAGKLEHGENPDIAAKRELEEETGYIAEKWTKLGFIYTTPGICDEKLYLYLAENLSYKKQHLDEDEFLRVNEYSMDKVYSMINKGIINDSKTICSLMRAEVLEALSLDVIQQRENNE
ncbi:NUDIX hydrolase [bacterium]|nr:NUDIX hydrolase [bacterium]